MSPRVSKEAKESPGIGMRDFSRTVLLMTSKGFANQLSQMVFWNLLSHWSSSTLSLLCHFHTAWPTPDDHHIHEWQCCLVSRQLSGYASRKTWTAFGIHNLLKGFHVCEWSRLTASHPATKGGMWSRESWTSEQDQDCNPVFHYWLAVWLWVDFLTSMRPFLNLKWQTIRPHRVILKN